MSPTRFFLMIYNPQYNKVFEKLSVTPFTTNNQYFKFCRTS